MSTPPTWHVVTLVQFVARIRSALTGAGRPAVLAVNGHSSSGKSTLAHRLADRLPGSAVLHTDDLAWHESVIDWDHLLIEGVLAPVRAGAPVAYRPPAWRRLGRDGAIEFPAGIAALIIEGVGASRGSLAPNLDLSIWVETPEPVRLARDDVRVAAGEISPADYQSWMAEENAHLAADRPWSRARWWVAGAAHEEHDPDVDVVLATMG